MALTACRECGAAVPARSYTCPKCGAGMAPGSHAPQRSEPPRSPEEHRDAEAAPAPAAAYRPPPRPPEKPERFNWGAAVGWVVLLVGAVLVGTFFYRLSGEVDQRAAGEAELERQHEHAQRVFAWVQDTAASAPVPETGPAPTSDRAKRAWVISRMVVDRELWEREVRKRHGASAFNPPAAWETARFQANARAYPDVAAYVEGRAAAAAEIQKTSAAWMKERTAALARQSGVPAPEIAAIFPEDNQGVPEAEARLAQAMLDVHRHLVRMDPRVRPGGGNQLLYEREDDLVRFSELVTKLNEATQAAGQARQQRLVSEINAIPRIVRVIRQ